MLEGHYCLVRNEDLPEGFDESDELQLEGYSVLDTSFGKLGRVVRIEENPAHPLMVVDRGANEGSSDEDDGSSELLIPVVDAFIDEINEEERIIYTSIPDGLLDL